MATTLAIIGTGAAVVAAVLLLWSTLLSGRDTRAEFADAKRERAGIRSDLQDGLGTVRSDLQDGLGTVRSEVAAEVGAVRADMQAGFDAVLERLPVAAAAAGSDNPEPPAADPGARLAAAADMAADLGRVPSRQQKGQQIAAARPGGSAEGKP